MPSETRELLCMKCGVEHPVWSADNELWNAVVRRPDGSDEWPFLCPTCFMRLAEERGIETNFRVRRAAHQDGSCVWTVDEDGNYHTACDGMFIIIEGTPLENGMNYCCYCGRALTEADGTTPDTQTPNTED